MVNKIKRKSQQPFFIKLVLELRYFLRLLNNHEVENYTMYLVNNVGTIGTIN